MKRFESLCNEYRENKRLIEELQAMNDSIKSDILAIMGNDETHVEGAVTRYAFLPTQYHTESKEFVHANFGWGGQKDGYYTFNAFYTDRGPVSPQSIEDRDYDHDFSAVTYNLSK